MADRLAQKDNIRKLEPAETIEKQRNQNKTQQPRPPNPRTNSLRKLSQLASRQKSANNPKQFSKHQQRLLRSRSPVACCTGQTRPSLASASELVRLHRPLYRRHHITTITRHGIQQLQHCYALAPSLRKVRDASRTRMPFFINRGQ